MEEIFTYDDMNRLTGVTLKRPSGQDLHCAVAYDALGRMTSKQAVTTANGTPQVTTTFSLPSFDPTKVHAMAQAQTSDGLFPSATQTLTYTGFDKVSTLKQGNDSIRITYGYDRQRTRMQELTPGTSRTKDYAGSCEFITASALGGTGDKSLTYLSGPYGVFAVVESHLGSESLHYILKDNLGSWVTITNANGTVEQQMSFDAWGNRRDPQTWANYTANDAVEEPMFDRGFTGHEHLYSFGRVNMNGRVYDPTMSAFLSPDRYVQDPLSAQGFNRYAYCMYNPLRLTDPSGWLAGGGGGGQLPTFTLGGITSYVLPEVVVIPDNPSLSNTPPIEEVWYTPNMNGGGAGPQWSNVHNGQSIGPSGSGGGSHGGTTSQTPINPSNNGNLAKQSIRFTNEANSYITSTNTIINKGAEFAKETMNASKEVEAAIVLGKVSKVSKVLGSVGLVVNYGCTIVQVQQNIMPWQEGVVRVGMSTVEFAISGVPYVGPILSIGLTAFDIGGGFDNNLYKTENWWK